MTQPAVTRVLMVGAPGSGKGTVGQVVADRLGVPHISSGQLLRATLAAGDPYGIGPLVAEGALVPDDVVARVVGEWLEDGYVLDGYPRAVDQARHLDAVLDPLGRGIQVVLELDVDDDEVRVRLARRAGLEGRPDDDAATVDNRLVTYHEVTEELLAYYRDRVRPVDGTGAPDEVVERALAALGVSPATAGRPPVP